MSKNTNKTQKKKTRRGESFVIFPKDGRSFDEVRISQRFPFNFVVENSHLLIFSRAGASTSSLALKLINLLITSFLEYFPEFPVGN